MVIRFKCESYNLVLSLLIFGTALRRAGQAHVGWFDKNSGGETHEVGLLLPNALGLYDMSGNVWEWCADTWHDDYRGAPPDGKAWVEGGDADRAVLRGGSWISYVQFCRVARRHWYSRTYRNFDFGFRLARGG